MPITDTPKLRGSNLKNCSPENLRMIIHTNIFFNLKVKLNVDERDLMQTSFFKFEQRSQIRLHTVDQWRVCCDILRPFFMIFIGAEIKIADESNAGNLFSQPFAAHQPIYRQRCWNLSKSGCRRLPTKPVQTATTVKPIKTTTGPVKKYCEFTFRNSQSADEVVRLINNKSRLSSIFCYRYNTIVIPNIWFGSRKK